MPRRRSFAIIVAMLAPLLCGASPSTFDVTSYGAVAGDGKDDAPAFQLAVDRAGAFTAAIRARNPGYRGTATVFVPAPANGAAYEMMSTVWVDSPFVRIVGEGEGSCLQAPNTSYHPIFLFGLRRQVPAGPGIPRPLVADASYRPDLFGKLDATAASARGQRWGFRSNGDSFIQAQATPLDAGGRGQYGTADNWLGAKTLTIEVAVEGPGGGAFPAGVPILCLGNPGALEIGPFTLHSGDVNAFVLQWSTQAKPFGPKKRWRVDFSTGSATGVQRLAMQIDCNTGQVAAFNGTAVLSSSAQMASDTAAGLSLAENDYYPMLIGDGGGARPSLGNVGGYLFSLYGCCLSRTPRYQFGRAGTQQKRADNPNAPITDQYRYFTPRDQASSDFDAGTIGYLSFEDNPATLGRRMTVRHGQAAEGWGASSAFLLHSLMTIPGGVAMDSISGVRLIGGGHYGQNVAVGQVIDFGVADLRSENAYHAVGSFSNGANYLIRADRCYLQGSDAGIFGNSMIFRGRDLNFPSAGRSTMRFVGSNWDVRDVFVGQWSANNQSTLISHGGDYGGTGLWQGGQVDYEGPGYQRAAVVVELAPYMPATARLQDLWFGTTGGVPAVELSGAGATWFPPGKLMLSNVAANGGTTPIVATASRWGVDGSFTPKVSPIIPSPIDPVPMVPATRPALPN